PHLRFAQRPRHRGGPQPAGVRRLRRQVVRARAGSRGRHRLMTPEPASAAAHRRLLSAAAYAGMFVFGIVMALLGAVLPALSGRLAFEVADIGRLLLYMN